MAKGKVGIVGLGIMGGAFARNLVTAGWRVVGYDIDANRCRATARAGAEIAPDARAQAKTKDLVVYASGQPKAIRALRPLFAGFARAVHDLGAFGNGSRMKYVANLLVAINNVASAEAMVLGLKAGLDAQTVFDMVRSGAANSRVFELRAPMMVRDRYDDATMKVSIWQKDMAVIGEFARERGCPTPMVDATVPAFAKAV